MSNVRLSDDSNQPFLIRWRGKQEGPFTAAVIEGKLAANQISLLHEISQNGRWITLRAFLAERQAIGYAELQARNETAKVTGQDRQTRESEEHQSFGVQNQLGNSATLKPHRGGKILGMALGSLALFLILEAVGWSLNMKYLGGWLILPIDLIVWNRGNEALRDMDAGIMESSGRKLILCGRWIAALGAILKVIPICIEIGIKLGRLVG